MDKKSRRHSFVTPPRRKGQRGLGRSLDGQGAISKQVSMASLGGSVHSAGSTSNNPITKDLQLNILVHDKLDKIKKYTPFHRWKSKFLTRFDTFLTEGGKKPAREASGRIQNHLQNCLNRADVLIELIERGDLSPITGRKTVRAFSALKEFCQDLDGTRVELQELVPGNSMDERRLGYTKFHVGASLIEECFPQYVAMRELEDKVQLISDSTRDIDRDEDVLDKTQRELFRNYKKQVTRFCDVMASLDFYEIMLKCVEFLNPPEHEESGDEELTIFLRPFVRNTGTNGSKNRGSGASLFRSKKGFEPTQAKVINPVKIDAEETETIASVTILALDELGFNLKKHGDVEILDQLRVRYNNDNSVVKNPKTSTLKDLNIENGDVLTIEQALVPIQVRRTTSEGEAVFVELMIDPHTPLKELKATLDSEKNRHEGMERISADEQILLLDGTELTEDEKTCFDCGIASGSIVDLKSLAKIPSAEEAMKEQIDKILIVDTKYGTMFGVGRQEAIQKAVVTPKTVRVDDEFLEATDSDIDKNQMLQSMMSSPNLNVKPQIVIAKLKIEDYEIEDAAAVHNLWGVNLKKTSQRQRSTAIFFVDLKTNAVGFLDRKKLMDMNFITVVKVNDPSVLGDNKKHEVNETLEQAEVDQQKYDFFVARIRRIFGIESLGLQYTD